MVKYKHNKYLDGFAKIFRFIRYSCWPFCPNHAGLTDQMAKKYSKSSFFHHLVQITNESSQVDFDVVEHTQLLRAVLASSFFANLGDSSWGTG